MKSSFSFLLPLVLPMATAYVALAADGNETTPDQTGFLVLFALGFCALIVVAQLVPAIIMMIGSIRNMVNALSKKNRERF